VGGGIGACGAGAGGVAGDRAAGGLGQPDGVFATPVILDGRLYLRTLGDVYCIGE